ncbi:hypothetical protein GCM10023092_22740 [Rurimicrobium arvi]|uniref:Uncharacterized protein n=1 Tax=Rurimicrobium arvi TaxID=2049916 RepID=A0ABP8MYZ7_9BACT
MDTHNNRISYTQHKQGGLSGPIIVFPLKQSKYIARKNCFAFLALFIACQTYHDKNVTKVAE